jgi:hypothetical protein
MRIKEFKYFNLKICHQALGNMTRDIHPGSGSWLFTHPGSSGQRGTGSRIQIRNTGIYEPVTSVIDVSLFHCIFLLKNRPE